MIVGQSNEPKYRELSGQSVTAIVKACDEDVWDTFFNQGIRCTFKIAVTKQVITTSVAHAGLTVLIHLDHSLRSRPPELAAWPMESTEDGSTWLRRFSSYESDHNRHAVVRSAWLKARQDIGFSPNFIAGAELTKGIPTTTRLLVLPQSWAMSRAERDAASAFAKRENRVGIADGPHGLFDEHGTLRTYFEWPTSDFPEQTRFTFGTNPGGAAFEEVSTSR